MKKFLLTVTLAVIAVLAGYSAEKSFALSWGSTYWNGNQVYTGTITSKSAFGGSNWTLSCFNNNQNGWLNVRCGRKDYASVASIYNETKLSQHLTKLVVNVSNEKTADKSKLNSCKLYISESSNFTNPTVVTYSNIATFGDWTFNIPAEAAEYGFIKLEFDCASAANNGFIGVNTFTVYYEEIGDSRTTATLTWESESAIATLGSDFTAPTLSATPEEALNAVTYSSSNPDVASIDEKTGSIEIKTAGKTTITATIDENNDTYLATTSSYLLTVIDPNAIYTEITPQFFDYTTNSYAATTKPDEYGFTYSAVYTGSQSQMQFNTNNNNGKGSGIAVKTVGPNYIIKSIDIEMTDSDKGFNVYTSDEAFSELKTTETPSFKDELEYTTVKTSSKVDINAKAFAILPSTTGAMYIQKVTVNYEKVEGGEDPEPPVETETVATPVFNPVAGEYERGTKIAITSATSDASIYYTIDGNDPTTSSTLYNAEIELTADMTIKAIAVKNGMNDSEIAEAIYTVKKSETTDPETPSGFYTIKFNEPKSDSGKQLSDVMSFIADGKDYVTSSSASTLYEGEGGVRFGSSSKTGSMTLTLSEKGKVKANKIVVNAKTYSSDTSSLVVNSSDGQSLGSSFADYEYTLSGETLSEIELNVTGKRGIVKAITVYYGEAGGEEPTITFDPDPANGPVELGTKVTLACNVEGAVINYMFGDDMDEYSEESELILDQTNNHIMAWIGDDEDNLFEAEYEFLTVEKPVFTPAEGIVAAGTEITISCPTDGATIWYTTDSEYEQYIPGTTHIIVNEEMLIDAYATKDNWLDSESVMVSFEILGPNHQYSSSATFDFTIDGQNVKDMTDSNVNPGDNNATDNNLEGITFVNAEGVSIAFSKGSHSNSPRWWNDGNVRLYGTDKGSNNTFTVSAPAGYNLTKIVFTQSSGNGNTAWAFNVDNGTLTDKTWENKDSEGKDVAVNSVVFTNNNAASRFSTITVSYERTAIMPEIDVESSVTDVSRVYTVKHGYIVVEVVSDVMSIAALDGQGEAPTHWSYSEDGTMATYTIPEETDNNTYKIYGVFGDVQSEALTVTGRDLATGIENVTVDTDADAEFFTIHGVKVAADGLTPGLYIRRQGNKASKVFVK